jgi:hypothetical protein
VVNAMLLKYIFRAVMDDHRLRVGGAGGADGVLLLLAACCDRTPPSERDSGTGFDAGSWSR